MALSNFSVAEGRQTLLVKLAKLGSLGGDTPRIVFGSGYHIECMEMKVCESVECKESELSSPEWKDVRILPPELRRVTRTYSGSNQVDRGGD